MFKSKFKSKYISTKQQDKPYGLTSSMVRSIPNKCAFIRFLYDYQTFVGSYIEAIAFKHSCAEMCFNQCFVLLCLDFAVFIRISSSKIFSCDEQLHNFCVNHQMYNSFPRDWFRWEFLSVLYTHNLCTTIRWRKFIYIKKEFEFLLKLSFRNHCIKTLLQRQVDSAISSAVKDFYWLISTLYLNWSFDLLASLVQYEGRVSIASAK